VRLSGAESGDELVLAKRFYRLAAVVLSYPGDSLGWGMSSERDKPSQRGTSAAMAAQTTQFHSLAVAGSVDEIAKRRYEQLGVRRQREVRPTEMGVWPRGRPERIEVKRGSRYSVSL
jgi:hypothetical protein